MSKSGTRSAGHKRSRKGSPAGSRPASATSDRAIYICFFIVGVAVVLLGLLLSTGQGSMTGWFAVGYVALFAWLTNTAALAAYRGQGLSQWRQALARLPLRCAGYGRKGGKPVEAAHDSPAARKMIIVSVVVSIVAIVLLAYFFVPDIRDAIGA